MRPLRRARSHRKPYQLFQGISIKQSARLLLYNILQIMSISSLKKILALLSVIRRRNYKYAPNGNLKYANVLNRDFYASSPNQECVTNIINKPISTVPGYDINSLNIPVLLASPPKLPA